MSEQADGATEPFAAALGRVRLTEIEVPAGTRVPAHDHAGSHVCVVTGGAFEEALGRGTQWCPPATLRYSPAGDRHVVRVGLAGLRCTLIQLDGADVPSAGGRVYRTSPELAGVAGRVGAELRLGPRASPLVVESLALELFAGVVRLRAPRRSERTPRWLLAVRDALHDDVASPPSLGRLAALAGRHPLHVTRAFREYFGCSVGTYARRLQVDLARRRLLETDEPLASVALAAGFADQSHMTRQMRRMLGVTPGRLRGARRTSVGE